MSNPVAAYQRARSEAREAADKQYLSDLRANGPLLYGNAQQQVIFDEVVRWVDRANRYQLEPTVNRAKGYAKLPLHAWHRIRRYAEYLVRADCTDHEAFEEETKRVYHKAGRNYRAQKLSDRDCGLPPQMAGWLEFTGEHRLKDQVLRVVDACSVARTELIEAQRRLHAAKAELEEMERGGMLRDVAEVAGELATSIRREGDWVQGVKEEKEVKQKDVKQEHVKQERTVKIKKEEDSNSGDVQTEVEVHMKKEDGGKNIAIKKEADELSDVERTEGSKIKEEPED